MVKLSIFTTATDPIDRMDPYEEALECYKDLADEVVVGGEDWPDEFKWDHIGKTFNECLSRCSGDWVIRADLDYFFHEKDHGKIRQALERYPNAPAVSFWKYQFLKSDRYTLKSRVICAFNIAKYPDIKLDSGGDLCQPSLNGYELKVSEMPEARVPIWNYDFTFKTKEVVRKDFGRFARAWTQQFGDRPLGGPDDESAFESFCRMMDGRYQARATERVKLTDHPKYIQDKINNLTPEQFGYNGWGMFNA